MICPLCHAEYREGFTRCADCDVALVHPNPQLEAATDPNADPFCSFWRGEDARLHAEICTILDEAHVPHRTVRRRDHLFNLANYPTFELGVPFSLFERAEQAIRDAFELDPSDTDAILALSMPPLLPQNAGRIRKLPSMLSPADDQALPGPPSAGLSGQDASTHLWSGNDDGLRQMLVAALNENAIAGRCDVGEDRSAVFVSASDLGRAQEILREILEGTPPQ